MFWKTLNLRQFVLGNLAAVLITGVFVVWAETGPQSLLICSLEDGLIESLSAVLFGISCIGFVVVAARSGFLRDKKCWWRYLFVFGWALLMFVFMGEEISWGQRIFGFETPQSIADANIQEEFNLHNLNLIESTKYRLLSLMMLITGVLLPAFALWDRGRQLIQRLAFPVMPIAYSGFFVLSYLFGKYYYTILPRDSSTEVRELLMAIGMFAFALHGMLRPADLFRLRSSEPAEGPV